MSFEPLEWLLTRFENKIRDEYQPTMSHGKTMNKQEVLDAIKTHLEDMEYKAERSGYNAGYRAGRRSLTNDKLKEE